jgi:Zn-dependent protease with chaperone function
VTEPKSDHAPATFYDGKTPVSHVVSLAVSDDERLLKISGAELEPEHYWPLDDIREHRDQALRDGAMFGCRTDGAARLTVHKPDTVAAMRAMCPNLSQRDVPPRTYRKLAFWGLGAVASVLLVVFVIIPALADRLAVLVPVEQEVALGRSAMTQIEGLLGSERAGDLTCTDPAGEAALQKMVARLAERIDSPYDLQVRVLDNGMTNAFAVPGGQVVLFRGLISDATSPEMVAGVLAHEIGHVVNRDPTRLMLRSAGSAGILGMLLGDFTGGAAILLVSEQLVSAKYRQGAEEDADAFAHAVLASAGLPSAPLGEFFRLIKDKYGDVDGLLSHLVSHPDLSGRAQQAEAADRFADGGFTPVLSDAEWQALRGICGDQDAGGDAVPE